MTETFQIGQEASKSAFIAALTILQTQGTGVLATLEQARLDSLVEFDRRLSDINGRRVRAQRVPIVQQSARFITSDFNDIDQTGTTGTVRADSNAITLRERSVPVEAVIKTNQFTASTGTIEALDTAGQILQVHTLDGSTPTGQFNIELVTPLTLNQMIIDIVATPSQPVIDVSISTDGLTFVEATQIALSGSRITAYAPSQEARFIQVQVTPTHPDDLNGDTYTFGIIDFTASSTEYNLRSEYVSRLITFTPQSAYVLFDAPADDNIQYYISLSLPGNITPLVEVNPGDLILIPSASTSTFTDVAMNSSGLIAQSLPTNIYLDSLIITEDVGGNAIPVNLCPGLSSSDSNRSKLAQEYVGIQFGGGSVASTLHVIRADGTYDNTRQFNIAYSYGPQSVVTMLKVRLSTDDRAITPIFSGASLDVV